MTAHRVLLPAVATAAVLVPAMLWEPASPAPTSPPGPELPDSVANAHFSAQLPFGCPEASLCCYPPPDELAVLVQGDAVWVGRKAGRQQPRRIPRDGSEWDHLVPILREFRSTSPSHDWIQVAVDDRASYEDLLRALVAADEAGVEVEVVEPALPVYPHHGWMG